jgi:hypothetical protein
VGGLFGFAMEREKRCDLLLHLHRVIPFRMNL